MYVGEEKAAKARIKEILSAIENKDKEAMNIMLPIVKTIFLAFLS